MRAGYLAVAGKVLTFMSNLINRNRNCLLDLGAIPGEIDLARLGTMCSAGCSTGSVGTSMDYPVPWGHGGPRGGRAAPGLQNYGRIRPLLAEMHQGVA